MTGLLRLLAAILGAHIQRDDLPADELVWPDERDEMPARRHVVKTVDLGAVITQNGQTVLGPSMEISYDFTTSTPTSDLDSAVRTAYLERARRIEDQVAPLVTDALKRALAANPTHKPRPCWACGDPVGFHVEHLPCWDVPPFTRTAKPAVRTFADGGLL